MNDDFSTLKQMNYAGRGIVVGRTPSGLSFVGYILTGRSDESQARILFQPNLNRIETKPTLNAPKGDPELLYYPALVRSGPFLLASNGRQTYQLEDVANVASGSLPNEIIHKGLLAVPTYVVNDVDRLNYEPDKLSTPRISAVVIDDLASLLIVRRVPHGSSREIQDINLHLDEGYAHLIQTYKGDNVEPLAPFRGEPLVMRVGSESAEDIAQSLYASIVGGSKPGDDFRIAAACMVMQEDMKLDLHFINRHEG